MSGKMKLMIGGLVLGILLIFAYLGVKSLFAPTQPVAPDAAENDWQHLPPSMPNANLPSPSAIGDNSIFTRPLSDKPPEEDNKVELVGEPNASKEDTAPAAADTTVSPDRNLPTDEITTQPPPPVAAPVPAPVAAPAVIDEPPAATAPTGKLEIVAQTESGRAIKANVYVQQANGANLDKATYTSKAVFALKPGTYKITVRAEGYGSVTRNISVPQGAVVNEIFPLPPIAANAPAPAPVVQAPPPRQPVPQAPATADGKLRVVALSADDGSPLPVDFTVTRPDGAMVEQVNGVSLAELTLPAQEFIVSFDFQGFHGSKSLNVRPGQTVTHTFNIRGISNPAPPDNAQIPPFPPLNIPQDNGQMQPQQPQSVEEIIMQRLQEEMQKRLNN